LWIEVSARNKCTGAVSLTIKELEILSENIVKPLVAEDIFVGSKSLILCCLMMES
jgi:hypothetical protein